MQSHLSVVHFHSEEAAYAYVEARLQAAREDKSRSVYWPVWLRWD
jgi:hypothetical protein